MIIIEVHGKGNLSNLSNPSFQLKEKILELIAKNAPILLPEVQIMSCADYGVNAAGVPFEYLRIYSGNSMDFHTLKKALKPLRLALMFLSVDKFFLAE